MTGNGETTSSSPSEPPAGRAGPRVGPTVRFDAALAVATVLGESAVAWLWLAAVAAASPEHGVGLPFAAVAVPTVTAAVVGAGWRGQAARGIGGGRARRWPRAAWRLGGLVGAGLLGTLVTASAVTVVAGAGSNPAELLAPAGLGRPDARFAAGLAWAVAALAWGRGLWLGARPPTARSLARSVALGGLALGAAVLDVALDAPGMQLGPVTVGAALVLFFLSVAVALGLVRQRDLEIDVLGRPAGRPGAVWVSVLAVPLAAVAATALLVATAGLVVAGPAADAVAVVARVLGRALAGLRHGLGGLAGDGVASPPEAPAPPAEEPASLVLPGAVVTVLVGGALALGLWRLVRALRQLPLLEGLARARTAEAVRPGPDEEATSVFSWRHLLDQFRAWLGRRLGPRRHPREPGAGSHGASPLGLRPEDEVRASYYDVLVAARRADLGRAPTETSQELGRRLGATLGPPTTAAVDELTRRYEEVRYGRREGVPRPAGAEAATVLRALVARAPAEPVEPAEGGTPRSRRRPRRSRLPAPGR